MGVLTSSGLASTSGTNPDSGRAGPRPGAGRLGQPSPWLGTQPGCPGPEQAAGWAHHGRRPSQRQRRSLRLQAAWPHPHALRQHRTGQPEQCLRDATVASLAPLPLTAPHPSMGPGSPRRGGWAVRGRVPSPGGGDVPAGRRVAHVSRPVCAQAHLGSQRPGLGQGWWKGGFRGAPRSPSPAARPPTLAPPSLAQDTAQPPPGPLLHPGPFSWLWTRTRVDPEPAGTKGGPILPLALGWRPGLDRGPAQPAYRGKGPRCLSRCPPCCAPRGSRRAGSRPDLLAPAILCPAGAPGQAQARAGPF